MRINKIRRKAHTISRLFVLVGMSLWTLTACGLHNAEDSVDGRGKQSAEAVVVKKTSVDITVTVSASLDTLSSVPNPETAGDKVEVIWYQEDEEVWEDYAEYETEEPPEGLSKSELAAWEKEQEEAEEQWDRESEAQEEAYEKAWERQYLDFSFVGLKQPARVLACQIGCVTDSEVSEAEISYTGFRTKRETEKKQGNCLILALKPQTQEEDEGGDSLYLAVLDYQKRESYLIETGMFARANEQLSCLDLDGDGREEILSFNDPNKWMVWEIYQCKDGQFTNMQYDEEYGDSFDIRLLDDYKAKIICKKLGYEESFSLLDLGFEKKDLEEIPSDKVSDMDTWSLFGRSYKNGKVTEQNAFADSVLSDYRAKDDEEVWSCLTKGSAEEGLNIPLNVCLSKYMTIGTVYANLKYVEDTGRLELVGASFRGLELDKDDREFMYDYE